MGGDRLSGHQKKMADGEGGSGLRARAGNGTGYEEGREGELGYPIVNKVSPLRWDEGLSVG